MKFNLKEAAELGVNEGTNVRVTSRTMSAIDFAEPEKLQRFAFYLLVVALADYSKGKMQRSLLERPDSRPNARYG